MRPTQRPASVAGKGRAVKVAEGPEFPPLEGLSVGALLGLLGHIRPCAAPRCSRDRAYGCLRQRYPRAIAVIRSCGTVLLRLRYR